MVFKRRIGCWYSVSLKHLLIWILMLNIHYWLFFLCADFWWLALRPLHIALFFFQIFICTWKVHTSQDCAFSGVWWWTTTSEDVHMTFSWSWNFRAWLLHSWTVHFSEMEVFFFFFKWPFLSLKLLLKSEDLNPKRTKIKFGVKTKTDMVRVTTNPKMASVERKHDEPTLSKDLRRAVTIHAEV